MNASKSKDRILQVSAVLLLLVLIPFGIYSALAPNLANRDAVPVTGTFLGTTGSGEGPCFIHGKTAPRTFDAVRIPDGISTRIVCIDSLTSFLTGGFNFFRQPGEQVQVIVQRNDPMALGSEPSRFAQYYSGPNWWIWTIITDSLLIIILLAIVVGLLALAVRQSNKRPITS